jgi:hypothetical protein
MTMPRLICYDAIVPPRTKAKPGPAEVVNDWGDQGKRRGMASWADLRGRSAFRFKAALAIGASGNFGRPLITVDRGDTSLVYGADVLGDLQRPWRCPVGCP